jgi:hypothetical protein
MPDRKLMNVNKSKVKCFGERKNGQWTVVSLDLCLAAQAATVGEAKAKLDSQIREYLTDALIGEDKAHATALLDRKAPLALYAKYYLIKLLNALSIKNSHVFSF